MASVAHERTIHFADRNEGLQIVTVDNPVNLALRATFATGKSVHGVDVEGSVASLANHLDSLALPGSALGPAELGSTVCVADYEPGLRIVDVPDPTTPQCLGDYSPGLTPYAVAMTDTLALPVGRNMGLNVIDISDRSLPLELLSTGRSAERLMSRSAT